MDIFINVLSEHNTYIANQLCRKSTNAIEQLVVLRKIYQFLHSLGVNDFIFDMNEPYYPGYEDDVQYSKHIMYFDIWWEKTQQLVQTIKVLIIERTV